MAHVRVTRSSLRKRPRPNRASGRRCSTPSDSSSRSPTRASRSGGPRQDGLLPGDVFEYPEPAGASDYAHDYAVLYGVALADYFEATNDAATCNDLWETAARQFQLLGAHCDAQGILRLPKDAWIFVDWHDALDRTGAMHGIHLHGLKRPLELGRGLGRHREVAELPRRIALLEQAAFDTFFDFGRKVFVSGPRKQVSLATQAWMTIAGVGNRKLQAGALRRALADPTAVKPRTPYLNHYAVEALFQAGCNREAMDLMERYWGGMLAAGADTFWEAYTPENPRIAPYKDFHVNSFCHAWSCTPSYLLRRYSRQIV